MQHSSFHRYTHRCALTLMLCLMAAINVMAQNVKITGTVVDSSNEPIIGATVTVSDDTNVKAVTNVDGRFTINAAPGSNLHITYIVIRPWI